MAFIGRTSTATTQDPVQSLTRQVRRAEERLPEGFYIARYYWDVESGGTDLDLRSQSAAWQQYAGAGVPRDGGMAELRAAIASGQAPFAAVICENIERSGRDMYDALRLERELRRAGLPVFATDEPIDAQAPEAATILVRRVKQGMAEFYRYNLKAQMWEGLRQYVIAGYNTGPAPYGYAEDRTIHPNPIKASMGATRARLVPDPERGPWVTRMFEWRVYEKLDCNGIARRLTAHGAPTPGDKPWDYMSVYQILRNPKYTGRVVLGRTRNAGDSTRPGEKKIRAVPREHWTWAADENQHPALVPMELWEAAQEVGRQRGKVQDHTAPTRGRNTYPLRSRITCAQCHRRLCGMTAPGTTRTYYICPHNPQNPRHHAASPDHVRAAMRDTVIYAAIDTILSGLLSHDRAAAYAACIPVTQADADARNDARAGQLRKQVTQADTAISGLMTQLEQLGSDTTPAAAAYRDRIREQFTTRYDQKAAAQAELDTLLATQPPAEDPTLIDELPRAAELLCDAPADLRARIYAAFDVHALYRAGMNQATITAKITDATPQLIQALLDDPRTDHDTHAPARTNPANSALTLITLRDHGRLRSHDGRKGGFLPTGDAARAEPPRGSGSRGPDVPLDSLAGPHPVQRLAEFFQGQRLGQ
jgi:site-specific DNA recombinase